MSDAQQKRDPMVPLGYGTFCFAHSGGVGLVKVVLLKDDLAAIVEQAATTNTLEWSCEIADLVTDLLRHYPSLAVAEQYAAECEAAALRLRAWVAVERSEVRV